MSAFTEPLAQVRETVEVWVRHVESRNEALDAIDQVERLATNMETALVAMVYVHPCNCGDGIPEEACARCRAVKLLSFDPAVLSAREEGACRPNHYGDRPCGGFGDRCECAREEGTP